MQACSATKGSTHAAPRSDSSARMKHDSASTNPSPHDDVFSPSTHGHSSAALIASSLLSAPSPCLTASANDAPMSDISTEEVRDAHSDRAPRA